jgi:nucleotide-binding universal stress UspA family protein
MAPPPFAADDTLRAVPEAPRFLVGIDFSTGSRRALEEARRLASLSGATLTLAHVRPSSDIRAAISEERGDLVRAGGKVLASELTEHYARRIGQWVRDSEGERAVILRGGPDVALTREAQRGYTLLVLGTTGQNAVATLLMGATVERAIARATIPVLAVPTGRGSRSPR